jgi:hypothetical protein
VVQAIIYENPGCCRNGKTPSLESLESNECTFDGMDANSCQS